MFRPSILHRYIDALRYGVLSRKCWKEGDKKRQQEYYTWMLYEESDCVFLRLFECFIEAAPQLVLQLYILTQKPQSEEYGRRWGEETAYAMCSVAVIILSYQLSSLSS